MIKIPEGATHHCEDRYAVSTGGVQYYKFEQGQWFYWPEAVEPRGVWKKCRQPCKPVTAVQSTWNGPEDGLPPVGTKVTIENPQGYGLTCDEDDWLGPQLKVVMNYRNDFGVDLVVVERDDGAAQVFRASMCRTTRTAEQLAAEAREEAIREMNRVARSGNKPYLASTGIGGGCEALYDAGYRLVKP